jgi:hypothetical protein
MPLTEPNRGAKLFMRSVRPPVNYLIGSSHPIFFVKAIDEWGRENVNA